LTDDRLRLDVERLTYGFDALAHHDGQVVFVAYGAPGDQVAAEVVERRRSYLRARIASVTRPGPARVVPGCRWFPACGGCQWQHVAPPAQRDAKADLVREHLARGAGVHTPDVLPTLAAARDWEYRGRISLVVEGRRLGYHRARSHTLLEVDACPIAAPELSAHLDVARTWIAALRVPLRRVTIAAAPGGVALSALATGRPGDADRAATERLLRDTATVRGAIVSGGGIRTVVGDPTVRIAVVDGLELEVPCDVFTQVNPGANRLLVRTVLDLGAFRPGEHALDLYCGAGNFALALARRGVVVHGLERDPIAVAAARANAARLDLAHATFTCAPVAHALAAIDGDVDVLLLDPPRAGAADAIADIAARRAPRVLYVSCDPSTLARDVRRLLASGYRLGRVQPLDVFPQTFHVEVVAELLLT
jgi:23S rRNA (uracil1939-C5)-methyltransferase